MKLPRGFGKNYFSLTAITATVNQLSLNANATRVQNFHTPLSFEGSEEEILEELELEEICTLQLSLKPCHCNCYFKKITYKTLKNHPRQNLHLNYHKTLNNAISPPMLLRCTLLLKLFSFEKDYKISKQKYKLGIKMKKTTLLLSLVASSLLAENVQLNDLIVSSTYEPTAFSSKEIEYKPEIATTLPSNMLLKATSSGIKIDGATADFTSVYWNGIEVIDPSATNNYPTLMNYGRSASNALSIDGSNINYTTKKENSVEVEGGTPTFARIHAAATIGDKKNHQTFRLDGIYTKLNSAYTAKRGSYNKDEEKDSSQTYDLSYLAHFSFANDYSTSVALLHKKVDYDYDAGYPTNPDDTNSTFDSTLNVVGVDVGYDKNHNELKIDAQTTTSERKSANPTLSSQVNRIGFKGAYHIDDFKLKASSHYVKEEAEVSKKTYTRNYVNVDASLLYESKYAEVQADAKKSYKNTYSALLSTKVPLAYDISLLAKYENKGVNPTIVQEKAIYTIENKNLKSQKLKKYAAGLEYDRDDVLLRATYSHINTDDMIAYVTVDPKTYTAQYQNVDNTKYDFIHTELYYTLFNLVTLSEDYSNISNVSSSNDKLNYNLPKNRSVSKVSFDNEVFSAYALLNYTSLQKTYSGNTEPSKIINAGVGYTLNDELEVRADVYNLTDKYYEYNANYPQNGRLITATLVYNF